MRTRAAAPPPPTGHRPPPPPRQPQSPHWCPRLLARGLQSVVRPSWHVCVRSERPRPCPRLQHPRSGRYAAAGGRCSGCDSSACGADALRCCCACCTELPQLTPPPPRHPWQVLVLYASQTGTAQEIARTIAADAEGRGLPSKVRVPARRCRAARGTAIATAIATATATATAARACDSAAGAGSGATAKAAPPRPALALPYAGGLAQRAWPGGAAL